MGELYRARAEGADRDVALKVVRADLAQSPMFKAMFLEEGRIASLLHHPNLVRVDGFGEADGRFYLCMELVEGRNAAALVDHCRKTRDLLAPRFAVYIAEQVARGLHHAHRLEVDGQPLRLVHRDVSPGNILLSNQGAVKLTDFGVARIRREKSLTVAGMRKGTLRYMAPEQIQNLTDPRSDVFSLAAVLWELLVGRPLFEGTTDAQLADAVRSQPIAAPSEYAADVPPALDAVLLHALDRHPRARFQTAQDFAEALTALNLQPRGTAEALSQDLQSRFTETPSPPKGERAGVRGPPAREPINRTAATEPYPAFTDAPAPRAAEAAASYIIEAPTDRELHLPPIQPVASIAAASRPPAKRDSYWDEPWVEIVVPASQRTSPYPYLPPPPLDAPSATLVPLDRRLPPELRPAGPLPPLDYGFTAAYPKLFPDFQVGDIACHWCKDWPLVVVLADATSAVCVHRDITGERYEHLVGDREIRIVRRPEPPDDSAWQPGDLVVLRVEPDDAIPMTLVRRESMTHWLCAWQRGPGYPPRQRILPTRAFRLRDPAPADEPQGGT